MKNLSGGIILLGVVVVVALFLLASLVFMLLVNVPLHHFHAQTFDYGSSMASVALLSIFGVANNQSGNKS